MPDFDMDKIRNMNYDPSKGRYIGDDGSEFRVTPYSNGSGYKIDYYSSDTYGNSVHDSTHIKSDLNENWERTDNDRENGTSEHSSGNGCYLTTACMMHMKESFDDKCDELMTLRWFRDNYVAIEDIEKYYSVAPIIVDKINNEDNSTNIYNYIYENIVKTCVNAIKNGDYEFAYNRYKNSILALEDEFVKCKTKKLER